MRKRDLFHVIHSGRWVRMQRERARLRPPKGYLLLELAITLMLVAVIGIYTRSVALQEMDDGVAVTTGAYVLAGAAGLETYVIANTTALMNAQTVTGVANAFQPTLAELQALRVNNNPMLPTTFPTLSPTRQALQFDIQRIANAAGAVELRATACLNAPLRWRGVFRDDLVTVAMGSMSGRGGRSVLADNGATIRGALIATGAGALLNPVVGTPVGILCSVNLLSDAFYSSFARQQDGRTLNFSGIVQASGTVNASGTLSITTVTAGAGCTAIGAIAWSVNGASFSPARCNGAVWVATGGGLTISTLGATCTTANSLAATTDGVPLICQGTTYALLTSRMGGLVPMESQIVSNGSVLTKPTCLAGSTSKAIYLFPMVDVQNSQVVYRLAVDGGNFWTISMLDQSGVIILGDALAMTYCIY